MPTEPPPPPPPVVVTERPPFDFQSAARAFAKWRGIELRAPIRVVELDPDEFLARRRAGGARALPREDFITAFGLAPKSMDVRAAMAKIEDDSVAGFYAPRDKTLVVRRRAAGVPGSEVVVMHEIEHALQDQNFGIPDPSALGEDDAGIARLSLYEGDAVLSSIAFHVDASTAPSREWLVRAMRSLRSMPLEKRAELSGSKELAQAPAIARTRALAPYVDGAAFAADVVRAGGFALLNQAFAHPPVSTEQILHPDKYVAGDLPVPVEVPRAPPGYRVVSSGRMGELQLRVLIGECSNAATAQEVASGWGGDAYAVVAAPDGSHGVLLATAWDTEDGAARFAAALEARRACVSEQKTGHAETIAVRRDRTRVAYTHGVVESARGSVLADLLALPGAAPAAQPPLGAVTIPIAAVPEDFRARGHVDGSGRFESEPLGIACTLPAKPIATGRGEEVAFRSERSPELVAGMVFGLATPATIGPQYDLDFREALKRAAPNAILKDEGTREVEYSFARVTVHRWSVGDRLFGASIVAPACGGLGAILIGASWRDAGGFALIERWLASFEIRSKDAPVCRYLADPRR